MSNLYQYITENYKENEPFFLSDIQIEGMTENNILLLTAIEKAGTTDSEKVKRFDKGIYYLPQPSIFKSGARPTLERVLEYKYLCDKSNRCGYISGLLFFNQLGLTTQVPMQYEIVTNKATNEYRETFLAKSRIIIRKPKVPVTEENYMALQFLDMLKDVDVYSEMSGIALQKRLYQYMRKVGLRISDLESYFPYYPDKLYKNLVETRVIYNDVLTQE